MRIKYCSYCDRGRNHNCPDREVGESRCFVRSDSPPRNFSISSYHTSSSSSSSTTQSSFKSQNFVADEIEKSQCDYCSKGNTYLCPTREIGSFLVHQKNSTLVRKLKQKQNIKKKWIDISNKLVQKDKEWRKSQISLIKLTIEKNCKDCWNVSEQFPNSERLNFFQIYDIAWCKICLLKEIKKDIILCKECKEESVDKVIKSNYKFRSEVMEVDHHCRGCVKNMEMIKNEEPIEIILAGKSDWIDKFISELAPNKVQKLEKEIFEEQKTKKPHKKRIRRKWRTETHLKLIQKQQKWQEFIKMKKELVEKDISNHSEWVAYQIQPFKS